MKLYFLRHGKADWLDWDKPDDERPLTKAGRREMRQIARFLRELRIAPLRIVSSPLPRALETAEVVGKALQIEVEHEPLLKKGFSAAKLGSFIKSSKGGDMMLVGHDPDFTRVIRSLTGGNVVLKKGGLARVDVDPQNATSGTLVWLIQPKIARARAN